MNRAVDLVELRRARLHPRAGSGGRVALVHLPTITSPRSFSYYGAVPPLGLAYIAAVLREAGHEVHVVDATGAALDTRVTRHTAAGPVHVTGLTLPQIVGAVGAAGEVDVIGISHMFLHQWPLLRELATALKARHPNAKIVIGGENATAFFEHILGECAAVDACVLGEGERTMCELVSAWSGPGVPSLGAVAGVAYRDGDGEIRKTAPRARVEDIDALPEPAWDLFPVEAYLDRHRSGGVDRGRSMPLLTSRGCPYRCSFCSSPQMWTTRYQRRSPARVVDEIESYVERYGVTNVDLSDLTAMLTKDWMIEFAQQLVHRGVAVTIQLPSGTRSEAVDAEAARWLYRAGVRNFCYAPESGSEQTLDRIHKKVKLSRLLESLEAAINADLTTHASIIIGFPHEQPRELLETYRFVLALARAGLDTVAVMVFAPYPGSEEYEVLRSQGRIVHDEVYFYSSLQRSAGARRSVHPRWTPAQLASLQLVFLFSFYGLSYARRPRRALELARRMIAGRQESVMDQFLTTKLSQYGLGRVASFRRRHRTGASG